MASRFDETCSVVQLSKYCKNKGIPFSDANGILSKKKLLENIRCAVKKRPSAETLRANAKVQCMVTVPRVPGAAEHNRIHLPQEMLFL